MVCPVTTSRDRLEHCKNLLEQVVNELEDDTTNCLSTSPSSTASSSSQVAAASVSTTNIVTQPMAPRTVSVQEEHRRLFSFNGRGRRYSPFSQAGSSRNWRTSSSRAFKPPTWTRNFVCLASCEATSPPSSKEYLDLRKAGLGEQKITFNISDGPFQVDMKLKETFPKLANSGGYSFMKTQERGSRILLQLNGPYSVELLKQATGQRKIFVQPLQCDLSMDEVERAKNIVSKHFRM